MSHRSRPARAPTRRNTVRGLLARRGSCAALRAALAGHVSGMTGAEPHIAAVYRRAEAAAFAAAHRGHLAPRLSFELAHQGRPTAAMAWVAAAGGLAADLRRWAARLGVAGEAR